MPRKLEIGNIIPLASDPENDYIIISDTELENKWISFIKTRGSKEIIVLGEIPTVSKKKFNINGKEYVTME